MKKIQLYTLSLLASLLFACSPKSTVQQVLTPDMVISTLNSSTWKITWYVDSGKDETSDYVGALITFNTGGNLLGSQGLLSYPGTWASEYDDNVVKLDMDFGGVNPFSKLNDDWRVLSRTENEIKLSSESGGGSGIDYLTLVRN
jgi:hypothetical protein